MDALKRMPNFSYEVHAEVYKVVLHDDGKTAKGVLYFDATGNEVFQPAKIVVLSSFQLYNVRLMLLSGIGKPYNPITEEGVVGRKLCVPVQRRRHAVLQRQKLQRPSPPLARPVRCLMISRLATSTVPGLGFLGGAKIHSSQATGTPIGTALPKGTPGWGHGVQRGAWSSGTTIR